MTDLVLEPEEITEAESMALAQFVKRVGWQEIRDAIGKLQTALSTAGFSPR